jgi:hypothetical protein
MPILVKVPIQYTDKYVYMKINDHKIACNFERDGYNPLSLMITKELIFQLAAFITINIMKTTIEGTIKLQRMKIPRSATNINKCPIYNNFSMISPELGDYYTYPYNLFASHRTSLSAVFFIEKILFSYLADIMMNYPLFSSNHIMSNVAHTMIHGMLS